MLTERVIRGLKATGKTFSTWDSKVVGLGVQVTAGGTKNYVLRYKLAGRKRQAILSRVEGVRFADIRKRAAAELLKVRVEGEGILERQHEARTAPAVADLAERFLNETAPARIKARRMAPSTLVGYRNQIRKYIVPRLGRMPGEAVTRRDIERLSERMAGVPAMRNRTLALLSRLFTLAEHWGWRPQHTNPVRGVDRAREDARDRTLNRAESARLSDALGELDVRYPVPVAAIRVAALSGLRISEVLSLTWDSVDVETGRAVLTKTKTGRRVVPLAGPVLYIITGQIRIAGNPYIFAGARGAAVGYSHWRKVFAEAVRRAGLEGVRLHDLRRTVATRLAGDGLAAFTIRDVLGHSTLTMSNRYVRMAGDALSEATERAAALTADAMNGR
ncbi:MAG: tyrosine-type recombinase/integrase [Thiotrichales bacterium]|nr:tyrosine-type recombinase/integrase [Thiotrichales bacterium]